MEIVAFWSVCGALWLAVRLSTPFQRVQALRSFWTVLGLLGGAGLLYELFH